MASAWFNEDMMQIYARITFFWFLVEVAFVVIVYWVILPELHKLRPPPRYHGDIVHMMKRTFDEVKTLKSYTFEMYVSGFCNGAKFEDIHIDNFRSFLAWGMFHKYITDATDDELREIAEVLDYVGTIHPELYELKPGYNPAVTNCSMTLEPLPVIHRPLIMYIMVNLTEAVANWVFLHACGFQSLEVDGMHYWFKKQGSTEQYHNDTLSSNGTEPIVFLHGISTGWMLYMHLVKSLGSNRTLLLVDLNAIKIKSLNFDMPTPEQFVEKVFRILNRHDIHKASFVGHSFGSVTAGWFVRYHPDRVSHLTLIDPVTVLLSFPEVAYSFLYRQPTSIMEWIIHVTAARELTISHALRRHFWWYNNALWLEDVPAHIGIVVGTSSNDEIIHPQAVHEYSNNCRRLRLEARLVRQHQRTEKRRTTRSMSNQLLCGANTENGTERDEPAEMAGAKASNKPKIAMIECVMWEGYSHGQILIPTEAQRQFIQMVHNNEKVGSTY